MRRHTRTRKRSRKTRSNPFPLVAASLLTLSLFAIEYWQIFLYSMAVLLGLMVLYLAYKIYMWVKGRKAGGLQAGVVRDSRYISPQLRQAVWARDMGRCVQCESQSLLEYDHIIPLSKGGATSYENLQILCRACNRHKSDHI